MGKGNKNKFKLICFDLDGTIIDEITNFWRFVCEEFGCDLKRKDEAYEKFFSDLITYDEWVEHDVNLWIEKGITKKQLRECVKKLKLVPGALETIRELKKRGMKIGIISDSIETELEALVPGYRGLFDDIMINRLLFDKEGKISGWEATPYGMEKKADGLKRIAERENIDMKECVFVGDSHGDIRAVKEAGLGISFNSSSEELDRAADVVIKKKDLRDILKHV